MPVLDDIADPRRGAGIVFEHAEFAVAAADNVGAADIDIGFVRDRDAAHARAVVRVAEDQIGGKNAVFQDLLVVIEVIEQQVQRGHPLNDAGLDVAPFLGRDQAGDRIERQDPVDRAGLRVDRKGDPVIIERLLGGDGAPAEVGYREPAQTLAQPRRRSAAQHLAIEPLRVVAVEHESRHLPLRLA